MPVVHADLPDAAGAPDNSLLEISRGISRLYKDAVGRGPSKVQSRFADPDTLVVVLERTLTLVERKLRDLGEHQRLLDARLFIQSALEQHARTIVEQVLLRRTVAFVTGIDTRNDVAMMLFTLE